jgi:hypothetical protein
MRTLPETGDSNDRAGSEMSALVLEHGLFAKLRESGFVEWHLSYRVF